MATQFLLPCPACRRELPIDAGQAGDRLHCSCGQAFDAPTLREIRRLKPAETSDKEGTANWEPRQGVMLLGAVLLAIGLVPAIFLVVTRPREPVPDIKWVDGAIRDELDKMSLIQTWLRYQYFLNRGLQQDEFPAQLLYKEAYQTFLVRLTATLAVAIVGLCVLLVGLLLRRPSPQPSS